MKLKIKKRSSKRVNRRKKTKIRIRRKIYGTSDKPRLSVFKSHEHIYAQLIDDENHKTLAAASSLKMSKSAKKDLGKNVGMKIAEAAKKHKISKVVFDRNGYLYHGSVQSLSEGAREGGLKF